MEIDNHTQLASRNLGKSSVEGPPRGRLRVLAFTGGNAPSGYARLHAYVPSLARLGVDVAESPSRAGMFPPVCGWRRPGWALWNLADRAPAVVRSYAYDLTFVQRELLSTFVTFEPLLSRPRVFDVDDAIWTHPRGSFARRIAGLCDHVICGNRFLAEEFSRWNAHVSVIPTPVETHRFCPAPHMRTGTAAIGWLGLSCGFKYLYDIEPALAEVLRRHPRTRLRIVSDCEPQFRLIPPAKIEFVPYRRDTEVKDIQEMTIGIMPLDHSTTARGKCSFKMLLYMACGIPAVVTPVGMNADVLQHGDIALAATSHSEWVDALDLLLREPELRAHMGEAGRQVVTDHYSVERLSVTLAATLFGVAS